MDIRIDVSFFKLDLYDNKERRKRKAYLTLILQTTNKQFSWDGTYKTKDCNAGIYAYQAQVEYVNGTSETRTGNITLIR